MGKRFEQLVHQKMLYGKQISTGRDTRYSLGYVE